MSHDFIVVNKKNCKLKVQQEYRPLSVLGEAQKEIVVCPAVIVDKDEEIKVLDEVAYDEGYERVLLITNMDSTGESLDHSLVGFPNEERIFIVPAPVEPHMDLVPEPAYDLSLMLAGAANSYEALQLIQDKQDDDLLHITKELKAMMEAHHQESSQPEINVPDDNALQNSTAEPPTASSPPASPSLTSSKMAYASKTHFSVAGAFHKLLPHQLQFGAPVKSSDIPIRIRRGPEDGLNEQETAARKARLETIQAKLGPKPPVIGTCTSGGGMRAMLASCGFFSALKHIGVLDVAMYQCALSGSTWSTSKWMNSEGNPFVQYEGANAPDCWSSDVPFESLGEPNIDKLLEVATKNIFAWDSFKKYLPLLIQSRSFLLVYSLMLGEKMQSMGADYEIWKSKTLTGKYPIAVCTSVFKQHDTHHPFPVVDQTAFEIGSTALSTYYSPAYYQLENFKHPLPIGLNSFMAVWGSAFYANLSEIITDLPGIVAAKIGHLSAEGAKVVNANYNRKDPVSGDLLPFANQRYLYFRDGGVLANIPIEPMLRPERTLDILIILDSSTSVVRVPFGELIKALPSIQPAIPQNPTFPYVFPKTNTYPTIIYIPVVKDLTFRDPHFDPADCGTFEFTYSKEQAKNLHDLVHHTVVKAKDVIWQTINAVKDDKNLFDNIMHPKPTETEQPLVKKQERDPDVSSSGCCVLS